MANQNTKPDATGSNASNTGNLSPNLPQEQVISNIATAPAERAAQTLANATSQSIAQPAIKAIDAPVFSWAGYFQAIGLLCIILALMWLVVYFVRKYGKFRFMPAPGGFPQDGLQIEAQLPIGPRKGLMVVRFLDRRILLGVTEQQITMLTEENANNASSNQNFAELIKNSRRQESDSG